MPNRLLRTLLITTLISTSGCSSLKMPDLKLGKLFKYPDIHKVTIQQGNVLRQEMVDQLRPGMTRAQVRYIFGTPLLTDSFDQDRWDYIYIARPPGRGELRERVTIYFENDRLSHFSGDFVPNPPTAALETTQAAGDTTPIEDEDNVEAQPIPDGPSLEPRLPES